MTDLFRKTIILLIGVVFILIGIPLLILPGPGILVILLGLAVIGAEFPTVRRWTARTWERIRQKTPLR